jgi:nitroimidazol reductase NimA-like FMN-containing flavoprotein (pyridoxamine 5'-phosphate oxidase superfamily)
MSAADGKLSPEEIDEFLAQPIIARIGTVKPDGAPHVAAMWQQWDGEAMWVIPRSRSSWFVNLSKEPRVCILCADDIDLDLPPIALPLIISDLRPTEAWA